MLRTLACALAMALVACGHARPRLELVETSPVETTLGHAEIPEAYQVWPEMIAAARRTVDLAQFYLSNAPGGRLEPIVAALEAAADRGVIVRMLVETSMADVDPATIARLATHHGIEVRRYDLAARTNGILHAKYFVVDGAEAFLGSQNFDWRSLEHIQELGLRTRLTEVIEPLGAIFELDWALAGGVASSGEAAIESTSGRDTGGGRAVLVASPRELLPRDVPWELSRLVRLIDGAERSVRVQLLTYSTDDHGERFGELEDALLRAAARGVVVELLLSDWCKGKGTIEGLKRLVGTKGLVVRLVTVPPASRGFIPYARVIHSKYMVIDGRLAWVGTSNWEKEYFYRSRNVGVILDDRGIAASLERVFATGWVSAYAEPVDPTRVYVAPRVE